MTSEVTEFVPSDASGLVSCVCVTQPGRLALLQRAVLNFLAQEYPDRELIIMTSDPGYAEQVHTFLSMVLPSFEVSRRGAPKISLRTHSFGSTQEAVVQAMAYARGEWICIWDDDDLSHPSRLENQLRYTPAGKASALTKSLYFFYESSELFVTGFEQPGGSPHERCSPSSLIFSRQAYPGFDLSNHRQLKDSFPIHFINSQPGIRGGLSLVPHLPYSFITCVHADNVRGGDFHRRAASGLPVTRSREWILEYQDEITESLDKYQWSKGDIAVSGKDAQAFIYEPEKTWPSLLDPIYIPESTVESGVHSCPSGEKGEKGEPGEVSEAAKLGTQIKPVMSGASNPSAFASSKEKSSVEE